MSSESTEKIFETEFIPQLDALYAFAFNLTKNESDAEDLVQDTYLKAFRFIKSYEVGTNPKAWLFRILKNSFINKYRSQQKKPVSTEIPEDIPTNGNFSFENLLGDEVTKAMDQLPRDYKTVLLLCDVEDFSYEEIAEILEIPLGTVRSRIFRARNTLKKKLKKYAESMGYEDHRS
jgi:RNA polymerase sigma factor (sigma-70 family)